MTDAAYASDHMEAPDEALEPAGEAPEGQIDAQKVINNIQATNLADQMSDVDLARLGSKVCDEFKIDETSRDAAGWTERNTAAMKLALQTKETKSYPWLNASNIKYPLISTAAIQFNARAYPAVIDGFNVVKGKVLGKWTDDKQARADRIGQHMSYQLLEEMDGWEEDTDKLLIMLPIVGCAFRKTYFDPIKGYNCSHLVPPDKFVVNYWARDLDTCPRYTHVLDFYPHEIVEKQRAGLWLPIDLGFPQNAANDDLAPHTFLEQHRLWDLDDDGYPEPYVVTVHKETQRVLRVVARYDETGVKVNDRGQVERIEPVRMFTKYGFIPSPDGGFYDIGFGTLLNPLAETINSTLNQLMDAGHLANTQGGFIGSGVSMKGGALRFQPGEWKRVETSGSVLRDSIVQLPIGQPSSVLFNLLGMLIEAAKDVTATKDILTGDTGGANMPVGTVLATIEQGLKTFTAIVKRVHRSLKQELACLYRLNSIYLREEDYFRFQDEEGVIARQDYAEGDVDVIPVSDPSMATDMQKLGRAQFLQSMQGKGLNDMEINKRVLEAASIGDIAGLMPQGPAPPPPEVQLAEKEAQQKDRELDQQDHQLLIDHAKAEADIAVNAATAQKIMSEAILALPQFQLQVAQAIDARVAAMMKADADGQSDGPVQQGGPPAMEGPPADPGFPPVPPGPAAMPGPPMDGGGPFVDPAAPDQGPPPGGVGGPGFQ